MSAFLPLLFRTVQRLRLLIPIICGHLCFAFLLWMPAKADATAMSLLNVRCGSASKGQRISWKIHQWCSYGGGIGGCQLSMTLTKRSRQSNAYLALSSNHPFRKKPFNFRYTMKSDRKTGSIRFQYWEGKWKVGGFWLRRVHKKKNLWVLRSRFHTRGKWSNLKPFHFHGRRLVMRCSF